MPDHDDWNEHWNRYAAAASLNPAQQMRHALIAKLLRREPQPCDPLRLLDIGSGQGDLLLKLRTLLPAAQLLGFEMSASGVEISRRKVPGATFLVADLFRPPEDLGAYLGWATHAACSEVIEHVDSPVAFLQAARPYLAENARFIVTVPGGPMSAFDRHIGHRQHFTRASISRCLQDAGYAVDRVYLSGFPFFNVYRSVVIARGEKLVVDVDAGHRGFSAALARLMMAAFRGLFRFNLMDSPLGWQVVATARKIGSQ
jgi:SAM-dependent methyltransferase